jgi:hypothetical protein
MSTWVKLNLGIRYLFGGYDSALSYLLKFINEFLEKEAVFAKVERVNNVISWALDKALSFSKYVPEKWMGEFTAITMVLGDIIVVTKDGKITDEELKSLTASFKEAKLAWEKED